MDKNKLIEKWLSGELTEEESKAFSTLEEAPFYTNIIEDASQFKASHFSSMPDFDVFKERITSEKTSVKTIDWFKPMMRIASVLIIGIGIYSIFFLNKMVEVETLVAEKTTIELPDESQVVLNALSEVRYNKKDWKTNREIELKGEAFFDVAKGAKFDVVTETGTVSVLGTEFNIKHRGDIFEVSCYEGTVRVVTSKNTQILQAGDNYKSINGEMLTGKQTNEMPKWINNMSEFQRTPVSEVFAELERQYGVIIETEKINTDQLFTGGFAHDNLQSALKAISEPLGMEYKIIKPNKVRLSMGE
ncbi:ferric-dicitrate binding protein FerR (iron transport regulator) [Saonia flava]|uniref:Ferric-dicitrate binding protein FerR (Iron transport regulator) n=1 Tax=Saonia flava TaxID=523696 RepID=A0A846QT37_9FLAO|nr:FecR family protein [Saonia flava]NJB71351.1 ferric-dicitrate binding protein FerR (iron transport regulator) [Saonia flava]